MPTDGPPPQESVCDELLAIAVKIFDSESALGERFGIRASTLVAAAMVPLGLTVNLAKEAVWSASPELALDDDQAARGPGLTLLKPQVRLDRRDDELRLRIGR